MGRKKKEIKVEQNSSIKYQGTVTVQKVRKGKVVKTEVMHNAGGSELFNFILQCLAGNYYADLRPVYVIAAKNDKLLGTLPVKISYTTVYPKTNNNLNYIEYKFFLPFMQEYTGEGFNQLVLYSESKCPRENLTDAPIGNDYSMVVTAEEGHSFTASQDEDLLVTWQLKLDNYTPSN